MTTMLGRPDAGAILVDDNYDQRIRWRAGERLHHLFEAQCDLLRAQGRQDHLAVSAPGVALTYEDLDGAANRLARHLAGAGVGAGDRVGLLFDRAVPGYVGMLAVLKLNAAYVPLDASYPADRLAFIAADAAVVAVLTESVLVERLGAVDAQVLCLDERADQIAACSPARLGADERGEPVDELAYIVYTSGTTGRPKGVAIEQGSICNFVRVAAEVYGVGPDDRMYQGMTIAFDFSVEEIWVSWACGATLVPKPAGGALVGEDLRAYLVDQDVSALCCVPTLLASLDQDVPGLRFLLVSGEACPQDLIARWWRPDRRFLNVYGPTEATVTATWTPLHPDRPVTIGVPLPTYSVVILDPDQVRPVDAGAVGEVGIAGIALSPGYLNRPEQTAKAFVPDVIGMPDNPSGRIYRTGDLGRIDPDGQIEYLGRIDTQVKIRGYRIELTEIESVLLGVEGIAAAVVEPYEPAPGVVELVGYYSRRRGAPPPDTTALVGHLRDRLPGYMVPAYLEELDALPMLPSDKVDRKNLPAPTGGRVTTATGEHIAPQGQTQVALAEALQDALGIENVSAAADFFDDLAASSILLARFCAGARRIPGLEALAMRDIYLHPSIQQLADATADAAATATAPAQGPSDAGEVGESVEPGRWATARYVLCGLGQLAIFAVYAVIVALTTQISLSWLNEVDDSFVAVYARAVIVSTAFFAVLMLMPVLAKWLLVGRWTQTEFPAWGWRYLRFWTVRMLLGINPMALLVGSPLYVMYLRALGARIGPGVTILSSRLPICTDLVTIGAGSVIRKNAILNGYRIEGGVVRTGPVTVGRGCLVGEEAVLEPNAAMGDNTQLGHASALLGGQRVPDGEHWHGNPAQPTTVDYRRVPAGVLSRRRVFCYGMVQLAFILFGLVPVLLAGLMALAGSLVPGIVDALLGPVRLAHDAFFVGVIAALTLAGLLLTLTVGQVVVFVWPRLVARPLVPGRIYPMYGFHYWLHQLVARLTNVRFFHVLFGDSSYIVGYLSRLGYQLRPVTQTGSNFGPEVRHDSPYLCRVGTGTMVSDGLWFANAEYSNSSFRLGQASVGENTYVGNNIVMPTGARIGDNCLLGTKTLVPLDGPIRQDVGLLGSPAFEIPRTVNEDREVDLPDSPQELARGLAGKNRHNTATIVMYLAHQWSFVTLVAIGMALVFDLYHNGYTWLLPLAFLLLPWVAALDHVLSERMSLGFGRLRPLHCSIYDPAFWRHERYWKFSANPVLAAFDGTPFKSWFLRGLGVRVGRRLLDDGGQTVERTLTTIGDDVTLGFSSILQGHSLENGIFKSDAIHIGSGATIGTNTFVHYGTQVGDHASVHADAFLMKGEQVPPGGHWHGNPARPRPRTRTPIPAGAAPD